jgi:hypothetical protein
LADFASIVGVLLGCKADKGISMWEAVFAIIGMAFSAIASGKRAEADAEYAKANQIVLFAILDGIKDILQGLEDVASALASLRHALLEVPNRTALLLDAQTVLSALTGLEEAKTAYLDQLRSSALQNGPNPEDVTKAELRFYANLDDVLEELRAARHDLLRQDFGVMPFVAIALATELEIYILKRDAAYARTAMTAYGKYISDALDEVNPGSLIIALAEARQASHTAKAVLEKTQVFGRLSDFQGTRQYRAANVMMGRSLGGSPTIARQIWLFQITCDPYDAHGAPAWQTRWHWLADDHIDLVHGGTNISPPVFLKVDVPIEDFGGAGPPVVRNVMSAEYETWRSALDELETANIQQQLLGQLVELSKASQLYIADLSVALKDAV